VGARLSRLQFPSKNFKFKKKHEMNKMYKIFLIILKRAQSLFFTKQEQPIMEVPFKPQLKRLTNQKENEYIYDFII